MVYAIWSRKGTIYNSINVPGSSLINWVEFRSSASMIFKITICNYKDKPARINFLISPPNIKFIINYFNKCFKDSELSILDNTISTHFNPQSAEQLIALFKSVNLDVQRTEFPELLQIEIQQIIEKLPHLNNELNKKGAKHFIDENIPLCPYFNPKRANTTALVKLVDLFSNPSRALAERRPFKSEIEYCLVQGENPYQIDKFEKSSFDYLFLRHLPDNWFQPLARQLLSYGANPYFRVFNDFSPIERGLHYGLFSKEVKYIEELFNFLPRSLTPLNKIKAQVLSTPNKMMTSLCIGNKIIQTIIKDTNSLTFTEFQHLFALFAEMYEIDPAKKDSTAIEDVFQQDFTGNNKQIEIIYDKGIIVGFNLFEIITLKSRTDQIIMHCSHSVLKGDYRGTGIMNLLHFRLAFALQILFPTHIIGIFFIAIHANSGVIPENLNWLYHPKYGEQDELVKEILNEIQGETEYVRKQMKCYVPQDIRVKETKNASSREHRVKRFFKEDLMGTDGPEYKGVPILTFVGDTTYKHCCELLSTQINFHDHINDLALSIAGSGYPLYPYSVPGSSPQKVNLINNNLWFWKSEKKLTDSSLYTPKDTEEQSDKIQCAL